MLDNHEWLLDWLDKATETCVLDIADQGGVSLQYIADILGVTRERIRQIEGTGATSMRRTPTGLIRLRRPSRAKYLEEWRDEPYKPTEVMKYGKA